jgi:translation initiation factor 1
MPDRLVYSTDGGRVHTCPVCGQPYKHCRCAQSSTQQTATKKSDGIVRVMRDRKHRGGKTVTVITGHICIIDAMLKRLRLLSGQHDFLCRRGVLV